MSIAAPAPRVLADALVRPSTRIRALAADAALVAVGAGIVAVLAQVVVPMWPVPITGQTLGVLLVGASLGAVRGASSLALYAALGLVGLPVMAPQPDGGHITGLALLATPSFGYVAGFILAALVVGRLCELRWDRTVPRAVVAFAAGSAVVYAVGLPWLAAVLSTLGVAEGSALFGATLQAGLLPFLLGDVVKALIAGALLPLAWAGVRAVDRTKNA
ncbi:biotin transporter BioY [Microbacterium telephonicum]|uniref:Biotin transporter n=1 Tax=Microbacterium telephonicum TaxID=1714841 RepID=A0A498C9L8_9MICO|nr:biotin transporter BioY [Microbacterium telephonicum]RLK49580.1 biotin transport system substrate-specific component [Microbacterium telephonicum]